MVKGGKKEGKDNGRREGGGKERKREGEIKDGWGRR